MLATVDYIWMDGAEPTQTLRSKTRIVDVSDFEKVNLSCFPDWGFDGSSTYQSTGDDSDLILKPVNFVKFPSSLRAKSFLVMCEVLSSNGKPHSTNTRAQLRETLDKGGAKHEPWIGVEQEYTLFKGGIPLGWPEKGFPGLQGPFYCGVGADEAFGRDLIEEHTEICIESGIMISGTNAEVMPGQWEFQIGPRGVRGESPDPLNVCDQVWMARWFLYRLGEKYGVNVTLFPKPVKGDWNGAGQHTNISTSSMRNPKTGMKSIKKAVALLEKKHKEHIAVYGDQLSERLTGLHETCNINEFKAGTSDRGASIRIPLDVFKKGYGYLEDRRPGANADPYAVADRLIRTICNVPD